MRPVKQQVIDQILEREHTRTTASWPCEGEGESMEKKDRRPAEDRGTDRHMLEISHLKRREIQAPIAACLIKGFAKVMGQEKALEVATAAVQADAMIAGAAAAEKYRGRTIKELARFVRDVWAEDDAMTIRFLEETDRALSFDVIRCRYAELYEKAKMRDLGFCLSCSRDEPFTKGFNPRMKLLRIQTIMQGASRCDFRFILE